MEIVTTVQKKEISSGIFAYTLKTGSWKKLFRAVGYKTIIAEALNGTVGKGEFKNTIVGYLISDRRVCLVLKIEHKKIRKMLDLFYSKVRTGIRKALDAMNKLDLKAFLKEARINPEDLLEDLFIEYELKNEPLIKLITGRKVKLPYYDPQLQRLKDSIHDYPFCSAIDYRGGDSPVFVKLLKKEEWEKMRKPEKEKK